MKPYKIRIESDAKHDIQEGISWYNSKKKGLGKSFHNEVKDHIITLKEIKFFQIRYEEVRCLPLKKFPYMIHYSLDDAKKTIVVRAILNTYHNP